MRACITSLKELSFFKLVPLSWLTPCSSNCVSNESHHHRVLLLCLCQLCYASSAWHIFSLLSLVSLFAWTKAATGTDWDRDTQRKTGAQWCTKRAHTITGSGINTRQKHLITLSRPLHSSPVDFPLFSVDDRTKFRAKRDKQRRGIDSLLRHPLNPLLTACQPHSSLRRCQRFKTRIQAITTNR